MKCTYCGAPVEAGRIFCLKCGEEVVWVPEYNAIASYRSQSEQAIKDATRRAVENRKQQQALAAQEAILVEEARQIKKRRRVKWIIATIVFLLLGTGGFFGVKYFIDQQNYNSFEYQQNAAQINYENGNFETADTYINRALEINSNNISAIYLKSDILLAQGNKAEASKVLLDLIANEPSNAEAYGRIIKIYENEEQYGDIKALLDACLDDTIRQQYADYIAIKPVMNPASGKFSELNSVDILPSGGKTEKIYYTLDGSDPNETSLTFVNEIELVEGTTTIKAISVNDKHIWSDVTEEIYIIELRPPEAPQIAPSSGEFTAEMDVKIFITVPEGCVAFYEFDKEPTVASDPYAGPIEMPEGEHTLYAFLIDGNGKQSEMSKVSYNLIKTSAETAENTE